MTGATHIITGAAVYKLTRSNKPAAFFLAFFSHFLLDAIPHYDLKLEPNSYLGIIAVSYLLIISISAKDFNIMLAGFLGAFPDVNKLLNLFSPLDSIHTYFHFSGFSEPMYFIFIELCFTLIMSTVLTDRNIYLIRLNSR